MTENEYFAGKIVILRALEPADIDMLYKWENNSRLWRVSSTTVPFSRFILEEFINSSSKDIFETRQLRLIIEENDNNCVVGAIDLFDYDPFHQRAGVGILIDEEFRQKGYAVEALELLCNYASQFLHIHQLYCNIAVDNLGSISLFENCGFVKCGHRRDWLRTVDGYIDDYIFQKVF